MKRNTSNMRCMLLQFHYDNLSFCQKKIVSLRLMLDPRYKRQYIEIKSKLDMPSPVMKDSAQLWEKISARIPEQESEIEKEYPFPPKPGFRYLKYIAAPGLALILATLTLYLFKEKQLGTGHLISTGVKPGAVGNIIDLPVKNRLLTTGVHAQRIEKKPDIVMVAMPHSRVMIDYFEIQTDFSLINVSLNIKKGGLYTKLEKNSIRTENGETGEDSNNDIKKIKWQVRTPAGIINAIGTTFFINVDEQKKTMIYLKEGSLEIQSKGAVEEISGPFIDIIDISDSYKPDKKNDEITAVIISFFIELEHVMMDESGTDTLQSFLNSSLKKHKSLFITKDKSKSKTNSKKDPGSLYSLSRHFVSSFRDFYSTHAGIYPSLT